jgi:hypothetical protein
MLGEDVAATPKVKGGRTFLKMQKSRFEVNWPTTRI